MSRNSSQTRLPFSAPRSRRCTPAHALPCKLALAASPTPADSLLAVSVCHPLSCSCGSLGCGGLSPHPLLLRGSPRASPERREAKQPQSPAEEGVSAPPPQPWSPGRPDPARTSLRASSPRALRPGPLSPRRGAPDLYLRGRGVSLSLPRSSARPGSVAVSVCPLAWALRLGGSSSPLGPGPTRPAPRSAPPRGPPPAP